MRRGVESPITWSAHEPDHVARNRAQQPPLSKLLLGMLVAAPIVIVLALVALSSPAVILPAMRDLAATASLHPLTGAVSSLGAFLWFATGVLCLFTRHIEVIAGDSVTRTYLAWAGVMSLYLCFDDFFMIHEYLAPAIGIHEKIALLAIVAIFVGFIWAARHVLLAPGTIWLWTALGLFFVSEAADTLLSRLTGSLNPWTIFIEDSCKWLGICAWFGFQASFCSRLIGASTRA